MPVEFEIKVVQVGESLKITIPYEICRALKIKKGDTVRVTTNNGDIMVKKAK